MKFAAAGAQVAVFRLGCDNSPGSSMFDETSTVHRAAAAAAASTRDARETEIRVGFIVNCLCVSTRRCFPVERHIKRIIAKKTKAGCVVAPITASKLSACCCVNLPMEIFLMR